MVQTKRPTLKTIADEMSLSPSAVSRIINGKGKSIGLSDATIEKTLQFADKIGYKPHTQAQNLRLGKTNTIGVILCLPEPNNSDMTYRLFKGIAEAVKKHSMALLFFDVEDTKSELSAIDQCLNARVDGIVATYREDPVYLERLRGVINDGMNVVTVLDRSGGHLLNCPNVMADHETGGYLAVEYLVGKGHRRIAHLASLGIHGVGVERFKGYKKALEAFNIPYQEEMVIEDIEINDFNGAKKLMELKELPDAVFCWNDKSALHAQQTFKEAGLNIEVVGFDNREFLQYMDTPFCSVDFPLKKVGETAVEILLSEDLSRRTVIIPTKLIKYQD